MIYRYTPSGVCSREFIIEVGDDRILKNLSIVGGCNGNTQGIVALSKGRNIEEIICKLTGIHCGMKKTSCPDQLARALISIRDDMDGKEVAIELEEK